jgi:dTDP-4-dehydrorhamnose reductase
MPEPVLITGGSSLLGLNWAVAMRRTHRVVLALHRRQVALTGTATLEASLGSVEDVRRMLATAGPSLVVHAAGLTNVEACEADPEQARHVNVALAECVAAACHAEGVRLVHVSSDHLFDGREPLAEEQQPPSPLNAYARTKAEAEARVLAAHPDALVVRTNFYGWGPSYRRSFSDRVIDALRDGRGVPLFEDVFYTPILASELARAAHELVGAGASGIVHVVGDERLSKFEFGRRIARAFDLDAALIQRNRLECASGLAPRPRDMSLSNRKARALLGRPLGSVDEHLAQLRAQEQAGQAGELRAL